MSFKELRSKKLSPRSMVALALIVVFAVAVIFGVISWRSDRVIAKNVDALVSLEKRELPKSVLDISEGGIFVTDFAAEQDKIVSMAPEAFDNGNALRNFKNSAIVGDSIVNACWEYGYLNDSIIIADIGVSVSTSEDLFDRVISSSPAVIFLCYGNNDIEAYGSDVDAFISEYTKAVRKIQEGCPYSAIYVMGVLPCGSAARSYDQEVYTYRPDYNHALEEMCSELGAWYFDASFLLERLSLFDADGIHPVGEFYPRWVTYLGDIAGLNNED